MFLVTGAMDIAAAVFIKAMITSLEGFMRSVEEQSWHLISVTRHVITTLDP